VVVEHCRVNPAAEAEAQREDKLTRLQQECDRLQERVRVLEEGQTQEVNLRLAASNTQKVQGNIQSITVEQYAIRQNMGQIFKKWKLGLLNFKQGNRRRNYRDHCRDKKFLLYVTNACKWVILEFQTFLGVKWKHKN
jgi:hypothetical protein